MSRDPSEAAASTWRLELVRPAEVTIRGDPSMTQLYRTRFQGRPAEVEQEGEKVTIRYRRRLLPSEQRRQPSLVVLNGSVPWRLQVHRSAARITSDLSAIPLRGFEVRGGGARELYLILPPPSGEVPIRIDGGASQVGIHRPPGAAVRFTATGGVSGLSLDDQRFGAIGGETRWQSQNYEGAGDRYDILISGGASEVTIDALGVDGGSPRRQGRLLATVLFTDIVGSTERMGQLGDRRWGELLDRHDATARRLVEGGGGRS